VPHLPQDNVVSREAITPNDRQVQLEAEIRVLYGELEHDEPNYRRRRVDRVAKRIVIGERLIELRDTIIRRGKWTDYLDSGVLPFSRRTAYDYIDAAILHRKAGVRFATIAKMRTAEIRYEAHLLQGSLHNTANAEKRQNEIDARTWTAAGLMVGRLDNADRRRIVALKDQGINDALLWEIMRGSVRRRAELPPREYWGRGLMTDFMADSGAWSAYKSNRVVDFDDYCNFLADHPWIDLYVNLDHINPRDSAEAGVKSFANFQKMRSRGLKPIPVFHAGENFDWLRRYLDEGCDYIGLSAFASKREAMGFYHRSFAVIANCGRPVRTPAFGEATSNALIAFPFTSGDSASWILRSQVYGRTENIFLLADVITNDRKGYAARTYLEAQKYARLEQEVREHRPQFKFYLGFQPYNPWAFPALKVVRHRRGLASFHHLSQNGIDLIRMFMERPSEVLAMERYVEPLVLLEQMRDRCWRVA
jgi:hypothetical protein